MTLNHHHSSLEVYSIYFYVFLKNVPHITGKNIPVGKTVCLWLNGFLIDSLEKRNKNLEDIIKKFRKKVRTLR